MKPKSLIFIAIAILSLIIFTSSINLPPFPSVSDLPYQAHSFNDAGYIRQLLKRGVKYFKLDVSLANRQSCTKNTDWNISSKCYKTNQKSQQYCCLALRGDTSSMFSFDYQFSTIDNFIDMLTQHLSQKGIDSILFFALNWQFDFQFSNLLVQNSIFRLAQLMQTYPKLHFGFGSDNFIFQYDRICRGAINNPNHEQQINQQPLLKLNQQACTPQRKAISKSRFFLQSGADDPSDIRDYYGRYRNFNTFYKDIISRCKNGFPSWVKKYPQFPLIFWQPSDQNQIQFVIQTFLSDQCRRHHGRDIKGLAITCNLDPEVFQFYLKRVNQTVSFTPMVFYPNNYKIPLQYSTNLLSKMLLNGTNYLLIGQQDNSLKNGSSLQLILLSNDQTTQKVQQIRRKPLPISKGTIKITGGKQNMVIVQKPSQNQQNPIALLSLMNGNLQRIGDPIQLERYVDITYFDGQYYILKQTVNPTYFNILKTSDFNKTSIIISFSLVLQKAQSIQSFLVAQDKDGVVRYFLSGSINMNVWVGQIRINNLYKSGFIGFGKNSKMFMKDNGMVGITMENGACNSGVQINNSDAPLCSTYKYDEFKPMTTSQSTVTLIQATLPNLMQYLQKDLNEPVTPCTQKFVHSKVLNGRNINVVQIWDRIFIASQYVHISQQGMLGALFCGPSNFQHLKNNNKGILGTIWSRSNVGQQQIKQQLKLINNSLELNDE